MRDIRDPGFEKFIPIHLLFGHFHCAGRDEVCFLFPLCIVPKGENAGDRNRAISDNDLFSIAHVLKISAELVFEFAYIHRSHLPSVSLLG